MYFRQHFHQVLLVEGDSKKKVYIWLDNFSDHMTRVVCSKGIVDTCMM